VFSEHGSELLGRGPRLLWNMSAKRKRVAESAINTAMGNVFHDTSDTGQYGHVVMLGKLQRIGETRWIASPGR